VADRTVELVFDPFMKLKIRMGGFGIVTQFCVKENQTFLIVGRFCRKHKGIANVHVAPADGTKIVVGHCY
jgi:hypothetical protein